MLGGKTMAETLELVNAEKKEDFSPYQGDLKFVFVSYSHEDYDTIARDVIHGLIKNGYRIWYDAGIHHGDWSDQIEEKINKAHAFVVLLSKHSVESEYVNREILQFCNRKVEDINDLNFIPIWLDRPCQVNQYAVSLILNKLQVAFSNITEPATADAVIKKLSSKREIPTECRNSLDIDENGVVTDTPDDWIELNLIDGVKEVAPGACKGRDALESLIISGTVEKLGKEAFRGCKELKEVEIPSPLEYIGDSCFRDCIKLSKLTIHGKVEIGERAFENCSDLESVILSDDLAEISNGMFNSCKKLEKIKLPKNLEAICDSAFASCSALKEIEIPDGVKRIDDMAFAGCTNLERVSIPDSVTRIGKNVFKDCENLKEIVIPAGVTKMDPGCFRGCKKLENIIVHEDNLEYYSENGVIYTKSVKLIAYPAGKTDEVFSLPRAVQGISDWAFSDAQFLKEVKMDQCKGLTSIGEGAFYNCDNIVKIVVPRSVYIIQDNAFRDCANLSTLIVMSDAISELGWGVLYTCDRDKIEVYADARKFVDYCKDYEYNCHPLKDYK